MNEIHKGNQKALILRATCYYKTRISLLRATHVKWTGFIGDGVRKITTGVRIKAKSNAIQAADFHLHGYKLNKFKLN